MFEQLMETEPQTAGVKTRKTYFMLTTATLGISLFAALIFSLFAIDLNIGMNEMDMVELVAPVDVQPEVKRPELESEPKPQNVQQPGGGSKAPTRQVIMARVDEAPRDVPTTVSTTQNTTLARPLSDFVKVGGSDTDSVGGGSGRGTGNGTGNGNGDGLGDGDASIAKVEDDVPPPPPVKKVPAAEKPVIQSLGVVNSRATSLPLPSIPAAAKIANAGGTVSVRILVDENGSVVSANAVSGNPLLRQVSEIAARSARFTPTLLSGKPIKISGFIDYRFSGNGASSD